MFACLYPPHLEKWGYKIFFFARSARESCFVPPHFKIRGAAHAVNAVRYSFLLCNSNFIFKRRRFTIFDFKNVVTLKSGSEVTQSHWKWHHDIRKIVYGFLLLFFSNIVPKTHRFWDIRLVIYNDLETRVRGHSRSSKTIPFVDRLWLPIGIL